MAKFRFQKRDRLSDSNAFEIIKWESVVDEKP